MTGQTTPDFVAFQSFDSRYVQQLREGVPEIEEHFAHYFGALLSIKLRRRLRSPHTIEDVRQETLLRVIQSLRRNGGIRSAERLGPFVHAVCRNVLFELYRSETHYAMTSGPLPEPVDSTVDLDAALVSEEHKRSVRELLESLPKRDRELLRLTFLEELDRADVCRRLGISEAYYRVVLHRARLRVREPQTKEARQRRRPAVAPAAATASVPAVFAMTA